MRKTQLPITNYGKVEDVDTAGLVGQGCMQDAACLLGVGISKSPLERTGFKHVELHHDFHMTVRTQSTCNCVMVDPPCRDG